MGIVKPSSPILQPGHPLAQGLVAAIALHEGAGTTVSNLANPYQIGTIASPTGVTWTTGRDGEGLNILPGSTNRVTFLSPFLPPDNPRPMTTACWFRANNTTKLRNSIVSFASGQAAPRLYLHIENVGSDWRMSLYSGQYVHSSTFPRDLDWHHYAWTWASDDSVNFYRDGRFLSSASRSMLGFSLNRTSIGYVEVDDGFDMDGRLGDFHVWDRVLLAPEVQSIHEDPWAIYEPTKRLWLLAADIEEEPPAAPSSLTAEASGSTSISLAWTDNSDDETGFRVERSEDGADGPFAEVATTAANATSYEDTGLTPESTYHYRVIAENGDLDSDPSNVANATTDPADAPPKIVRLEITGISKPRITGLTLAKPGITGLAMSKPRIINLEIETP